MNKLNPDYSTTRLVTRDVPIIEEPLDAAFKTVLSLPEGEGRQGEGGLRTLKVTLSAACRRNR